MRAVRNASSTGLALKPRSIVAVPDDPIVNRATQLRLHVGHGGQHQVMPFVPVPGRQPTHGQENGNVVVALGRWTRHEARGIDIRRQAEHLRIRAGQSTLYRLCREPADRGENRAGLNGAREGV